MTTRTKLFAAAFTLGTLAFAASNAQADQLCREYQRPVTIGGKTRMAYGTACMDAAGSWRIVNESPFAAQTSQQVVFAEPAPMVVEKVVRRPARTVVVERPVVTPVISLAWNWDNDDYRHGPRWDNRWDNRGHGFDHRGGHR